MLVNVKLEIKEHILPINAWTMQLIFNSRSKTKLAMLAFLYCGEIVKNSSVMTTLTLH